MAPQPGMDRMGHECVAECLTRRGDVERLGPELLSNDGSEEAH
jgi:hypothetical protein